MKNIKLRYLVKPRDRTYVKGYGFLSFPKNMDTHATKVAKNVSNKCDQKLLDSAKKATIDAIKTASKRAIKKTVEATGDLTGNKVANKIASVSKKSSKKLPDNETEEDAERAIPKKRYTSPDER